MPGAHFENRSGKGSRAGPVATTGQISVAGRLNADPKIMLLDPVTSNRVGNGSRHLRLAVTETADDEADGFGQIGLFSRGLHVCPNF